MPIMPTTLLLLLFLHHLADVAFQPSWLIAQKTRLFRLYEHSFVWAGTVSVGLHIISEFSFYKFIFLIIGHFFIDYLKYKKKLFGTVIDQALHYLQIIIVWTI